MSEHTPGARPDDRADRNETAEELDALRQEADTQVFETEPRPGDTQELGTAEATGEPTRVLPTVDRDDPLSIFDRPSPSPQPVPAPTAPASASAPAPAPAPAMVPTPASAPAPAQPAWTPPPAPLVKTTPRTGTIVWGFVILAIGVGVLSVAAGASLDVGLAMIWLLAAAGAVLIVASIAGTARRRRKTA